MNTRRATMRPLFGQPVASPYPNPMTPNETFWPIVTVVTVVTVVNYVIVHYGVIQCQQDLSSCEQYR